MVKSDCADYEFKSLAVKCERQAGVLTIIFYKTVGSKVLMMHVMMDECVFQMIFLSVLCGL